MLRIVEALDTVTGVPEIEEDEMEGLVKEVATIGRDTPDELRIVEALFIVVDGPEIKEDEIKRLVEEVEIDDRETPEALRAVEALDTEIDDPEIDGDDTEGLVKAVEMLGDDNVGLETESEDIESPGTEVEGDPLDRSEDAVIAGLAVLVKREFPGAGLVKPVSVLDNEIDGMETDGEDCESPDVVVVNNPPVDVKDRVIDGLVKDVRSELLVEGVNRLREGLLLSCVDKLPVGDVLL